MSDTTPTESEGSVAARVVIAGGGLTYGQTITVKPDDKRIGKRIVLVDTPAPKGAADESTEAAFQAITNPPADPPAGDAPTTDESSTTPAPSGQASGGSGRPRGV